MGGLFGCGGQNKMRERYALCIEIDGENTHHLVGGDPHLSAILSPLAVAEILGQEGV